MNKKIDTVLSLLETCEANIRTIKAMLNLTAGTEENPYSANSKSTMPLVNHSSTGKYSIEVGEEFQEGYFDGENMIGDNGQVYPIPQNYASKSQLVIGDRLKWILTRDNNGEPKEVYKLTMPVVRERVIGRFMIEENNYAIVVSGYPNPIKILKASATYAMKNLDLKIGDEVAVYIPKTGTPTWGAFINVVSSPSRNVIRPNDGRRIIYSESPDSTSEDFDLTKGYF
jgi:hypothetical protein